MVRHGRVPARPLHRPHCLGGAPASRSSLAPPAEDYNNTFDAQAAILCSESENPRRPSRYLSVAARADRRHPYGGTFATRLSFPCVAWPVRDADRYRGSFRTTPAHPALVMNTRDDPITPRRNAVSNARLLRGSQVLITEGWGHTTILNSARATPATAKAI